MEQHRAAQYRAANGMVVRGTASQQKGVACHRDAKETLSRDASFMA